MNIGIITFHASLNCGSMLQAYALQSILQNKYNQNVEIINYSNIGQRNYYAQWDFFPRPKILKNNFKALGCKKEIKKMKDDYSEFSSKYFNITTKLIKHRKALDKIENKFDIVIAGGDQVWNVKCRDADKAYFLSFVKNAKKVAYSPSLGARNINKYALNPQKYAELLKKFDYLSVRENNGQKWLKELTGLDVPIVADPTLLYTGEEWKKLIPVEQVEQEYIFYYAFSYSDRENIENLKKVSQKYNMPVYIIDGKSWAINKLENDGIKLWKKEGPLGFISMMVNAKIVLVQSFHGIVFSALFHKTFWSLRKNKIINTDDDRAKVILNQLQLNDRAITYDELSNLNLMKCIDYTIPDKQIETMRKNAFKYIEGFLNEKD